VSSDPSIAARVENVVAEALPGTVVRVVHTLDEIARLDAAPAQLIILVEPTAAGLNAARAARDTGGLPRWAIAVYRDADANGTDDGFCTIYRDELTVPVLRRVCRGSLEQHQLRRENARCRGDLTTFGFRIAHDLRTPLGGVLTTTEMLKEILSEDSPSHVPLTQPIIDSADGLVKLIERTSSLAKMSASIEPPLLTNMGTPFWNAFQQVESLILKAGASLSYPAEWPMANAHAAWIEIVWVNLISNALQYGGPMVRIEAGWTARDGGHRFWLQDSGTVAPERRAQLFHPFNRLHEPRAPRGLGLAIVRRIVELEGGWCGYEPGPERGSCFYFVLPAAGEASMPA
jgi:K+-sensing histidine kinase KdpD